MCVCVCPFSKRVSGGEKIENASNTAMELWLSAKSPGWRLLAALLSQLNSLTNVRNSSHFLSMRRGHVVYNNCALYMLLYKQCRGFYCCSIKGIGPLYKRDITTIFKNRMRLGRLWPVTQYCVFKKRIVSAWISFACLVCLGDWHRTESRTMAW